jgi:mannosyltransferase OCH1-like enzyme
MNKNIYHVWFQGCDKLTDSKSIINMKNWKDFNKDWNYECLDGSDLSRNCDLYSSRCGESYRKSRKMHTKIDLGRLVTIYLNGGMYIDMDMYILRPLSYNKDISQLILESKDGSDILGVSKTIIEKYENYMLFGDSVPMVNNAMVLSSQGNPLLKHIIDGLVESIFKSENSSDMMYVSNTTGPMNFNKFFRQGTKMFPEVKIKYFDSSVFEPCDITGKCMVTDQTISIHSFELSWLSKNVGYVCKMYVGNRYTILVVVLLLLWYFFFRKST